MIYQTLDNEFFPSYSLGKNSIFSELIALRRMINNQDNFDMITYELTIEML